MNSLAKNLAALLEHNDLSELELSRRIAVGQPILNRLISGKTNSPKIDTLIRIANYFSITVGELIGQNPLNLSKLNRITSLFHHGWSGVRLIEWDEISAHNNKHIIQSPEKYILTDIEPDDSLYALIQRSSAMEPRFPNGCVLICSTNYKINDGDNAIVLFNDQKTPVLRQVIIDGETIFLSTLNSLSHDVRQFKTEDQILGVVIQVRLDMTGQKNKNN